MNIMYKQLGSAIKEQIKHVGLSIFVIEKNTTKQNINKYNSIYTLNKQMENNKKE